MGSEDHDSGDHRCEYCGEVYWEPVDAPAGPGYMFQGHVLFECEDPDQMFKAWLNASPVERQKVWP